MLKKIRSLFICFPLFVGYIVIACIVQEEHPFSKFSMYSHFPAHAVYYYLADENNQPIAGASTFRFSINQLKDAIGVRISNYGIANNSINATRQIGNEMLRYIVNTNKDNPALEQYTQLRIIKCDLTFNGPKVQKTDSVLSICKLNNAY